MSPKD
jgi:peptide chain release factor subunit 1